MPPLPQVCGAVQAPQVSVPPQPSGIVPQFVPCAAQVVGVQALGGGVPRPQTFAMPPLPQTCGAVQAPQGSAPPQPLGTVPPVWPRAAPLGGVHPSPPSA